MFAFNRLAAVLLAFCLSVSVALGDDSRFEVKGEVTGVADSALIVLYEDHGNLMTPVSFDRAGRCVARVRCRPWS